jgi:hypothetical protein
VRQVYENLAATLAAAGATLDQVAKDNTYDVGLDTVTPAAIREARAPFMPKSHVPASTMVGTPALIHPDLLLEVEVIACVDAAPGCRQSVVRRIASQAGRVTERSHLHGRAPRVTQSSPLARSATIPRKRVPHQ